MSERSWRRGEKRRSLRVEVSWREEECMRREVAVASSGSGTLRVSSRAVEARLDVPAGNFNREGEDTDTTTYLLSYMILYVCVYFFFESCWDEGGYPCISCPNIIHSHKPSNTF